MVSNEIITIKLLAGFFNQHLHQFSSHFLIQKWVCWKSNTQIKKSFTTEIFGFQQWENLISHKLGKKKRNSKTFNWKILQFANRKREKFGKFRCCFHIYFTLRYLFKTNIIIFHCQGYKGGLIQADYCQNFSINFCSFPLFYFVLFQSFLGEKLLALIKNSYWSS